MTSFILGGGRLATHARLYQDIYVLSLPSFRWIKVSEHENYGPRIFHTCETPNNRQMIVIGGTDSWTGNNATYWGATPDRLHQGLGVYDLNHFQWLSHYDPDIGPYQSNRKILEWYANKYV